MKKIILSLIAITLISFSTSASNLEEKFSAQVNIKSVENFENQEINSDVTIALNSIQSLNELNLSELNTGAAQCSVTVTVSIGVVSVSIGATCDCADVAATIKRLTAQAKRALQEM